MFHGNGDRRPPWKLTSTLSGKNRGRRIFPELDERFKNDFFSSRLWRLKEELLAIKILQLQKNFFFSSFNLTVQGVPKIARISEHFKLAMEISFHYANHS